MEQKKELMETRFRVFPLWTLIYFFVFSIQLGIYDVLVAIIRNPEKIFSGYILLILFLWVLPLYGYFGIYISVSAQGIKRVCLGLPFWNVDYSFNRLVKTSNQINPINRKRDQGSIILEFDDNKKITVNQMTAYIFRNNVIALQYANFSQVLGYYKKNILIENHELSNVVEAISSQKMMALFIMVIVVLVSILISVNNRLMQIYFEWGWTYFFTTAMFFSILIYKTKKIDKRTMDNGIYSTLIGFSFGFLMSILLHLYVLLTVYPEETIYRVSKLNSYHITWHDVAGKAPELTREGYYIAKADFDKYKKKQVSVDIYYGPFGLVMMDIEQSKVFNVE